MKYSCCSPKLEKQTMSEEISKHPLVGRQGLVAVGLIILAGVGSYLNSFQGPFIFDGTASIVENPHIRQLWPIWEVIRAKPGWTVAGRPVLSLSLALNYQISELEVWSYHAVNLAVHILAALALFGIIRRTLLCEKLRARFGKASFGLALICALIWMLHPLQTGSVTYIVQRAESLMGLFYLLTMYCAIRGFNSSKRRWWYAGAIAACALGMGTKEVMATAPLMLLFYDRVFVSKTFKEVFARRWGLYVGLAATWVIFGALAWTTPRGKSVGFGFVQLSSLEYAMIQSKAIVWYYLKLSFWPHPLVLDYGWPIAPSFGEIVLYTIVLVGLLAGTLRALRYHPGLGFLGVWFFVILGPSSSFLVIITEVVAEHRMYLPLAAVVVAMVLGGYTLGRRLLDRLVSGERRPTLLGRLLGYALVGIVIVIFGFLTVRRNHNYRSKLSIWQDTVAKQPDNWRAYNNRGVAYSSKGDYDRAISDFEQAIELNPRNTEAYYNRGITYSSKGNYDRAIIDFDQAIKLNNAYANAYYNRGLAYQGKDDLEQATRDYNKAIELDSRNVKAYNNLAWTLATHEDAQLRDGAEAVRLAERACELTEYKLPYTLDTLAAAYAELGQFDQAIETAQRAAQSAQKAGKRELSESIRNRLKLYQAKRPYRESFSPEGLSAPEPK